MSGEGSTYALVIQTEGVDTNTGKPVSAHYYPALPSSTPEQNSVAYTQEAVNPNTANKKSDVFYTQEPIALVNPSATTAPTSAPPAPAPAVTALAIPSTPTKQTYPVIPDQPPVPQYQIPEQYPVATQYPANDPYVDDYAYVTPQYNTHPCMKASVVILFLLLLGFGTWFLLIQLGIVKSPIL